MKSLEIRSKFFDFFTKRTHEKVTSSSLIPAQDPTLLFANAGMNQFKDTFLGLEKRSYDKAVSIQKCVRAGGKHNDLDNVGFTERHLTFFEMMGNFSFGAYFKKEAIAYAWEFLTKEMNLPVEKLHASVFETDDEAYAIWHDEIGLPKERIHRLGAKDNFWQMGDIGPCGPCSEIHIDRGPEHGCADEKKCGPACDCDRFLEIWNLVFMQYDRQPDGTDKPLKQKGVDTGMGLERLCSVVQNVETVYETDLFMPIIQKIEELTGLSYEKQPAEMRAAFRVLADHIRSSSMIIADGCAPSNEGRGYVLRKIIRRAALFTQKLTDKNIFPRLADTVINEFGAIYPALKEQAVLIKQILESEIEKFAANLTRGQAILKDYFADSSTTKKITGEQAFTLYDTYGFPTELIELMAREHGYTVDTTGFEKEMAQQQERSRKKETHDTLHVSLPEHITTTFTGYEELETESVINGLIVGNTLVDSVPAGTSCYVITESSPFYIIGGGQIEDEGWIVINETRVAVEEVRPLGKAIIAQITAPTELKTGAPVTLVINKDVREATMKNHTATHMLQAALRHYFGPQVKQSGSFVNQDYLRFDFTYHATVTPDDITTIETLVNKKIQENIPLCITQTTYKEAVSRGVTAFFGDKYNPDNVRVVEIPEFSAELCGGTHVRATGDIGCFKIREISTLAAGHKRIVALTGPAALKLFQESFELTKDLGQLFKAQRNEIFDAVLKQKEQIKNLQNAIKQLKKQIWRAQLPTWEQQVKKVENLSYLVLETEDLAHEELKEIAHYLQSKQPGLYMITTNVNGRLLFLCSLSPKLTNAMQLKALGEWLKRHGLRGGGSKTLLQGGGSQLPSNFETALESWLRDNLQ